ncbi:MAG: HEAT repeat domain-containing protein [Candidatus Sericytochromatia bacterium]
MLDSFIPKVFAFSDVYQSHPLAFLMGLFSLVLALGCLLLFGLSLIFHRQQRLLAQARLALDASLNPLIVACLFQSQAPERVWEAVPQGQEKAFVEMLYRYQQRLKGSVNHKLQILAEPYLPLLAKQVNHSQPEMRAQALKFLATFQEQSYLSALARALRDPSPLVATIAFQALTQSHVEGYHREILAALPRVENLSLNYLASLLARKGPVLSPGLRLLFADLDAPAHLRGVAAKTLLLLNDLAAVDVALEIIQHEASADICVPALKLLEKLSPRDLSSQILPLWHSPDFAVRAYALRALARLGRQSHLPLLLTGLNDPSPWVARQAAQALSELRQKSLWPAELEQDSALTVQLNTILGQA